MHSILQQKNMDPPSSNNYPLLLFDSLKSTEKIKTVSLSQNHLVLTKNSARRQGNHHWHNNLKPLHTQQITSPIDSLP